MWSYKEQENHVYSRWRNNYSRSRCLPTRCTPRFRLYGLSDWTTHSLFLRIPLPPYKRKRSVSRSSTTGRGSDKRRERTGREAKIISNARHTLGQTPKSERRKVKKNMFLKRKKKITIFHFRREALSWQLKSRVGLALAKAAALRVNLKIDGVPIKSKSHTHPLHSQTSRLLTSSLSLGVPVRVGE
jgi:hypothetical protein